jgi:predicted dehydrogenase
MNKSRREFLGGLGLATAGIAIGLIACKESYKPTIIGANDKINVGLVGCSQRGVDQVWKGLKHLSEYQILAICDVIDEQMDKAQAVMPDGLKRYHDYRELVLNPDIDLVIVATPLKWHFPVSKAAILAGKHVVCEKSMTHTIEEAVEMEQLLQNYNKAFKVSYEVRNNPAYIAAEQLIKNNVLGEIIHADCTWNRQSSWRREVSNPNQIINFPTGERLSRDRILNWRMSMEFGGGLMGEVICHLLDATEWLLDCGHVLRASGFGNIAFWKDGRESFDNIHANLEYDNNLIISCNSILSNAHEGYSISIYGRNATIKLDLSSGKLIPEAVRDKSIKDEIDAVTGASYKLIKKSSDRELHPNKINAVYTYYSQFVDGYILDTLMGYKSLAESITKTGTYPSIIKPAKYNSIAIHLANKAMHEGGVHHWLPEYGS